jgi:hypothetical protein
MAISALAIGAKPDKASAAEEARNSLRVIKVPPQAKLNPAPCTKFRQQENQTSVGTLALHYSSGYLLAEESGYNIP